jgi:hypothetical protein
MKFFDAPRKIRGYTTEIASDFIFSTNFPDALNSEAHSFGV